MLLPVEDGDEDPAAICDEDVRRLRELTQIKLNLEMAATEEMLAIALAHRPHAACIVPERREERTTEGWLDAAGQHNRLYPLVQRLSDAGIRVSLFVDAIPKQVDASKSTGADAIEINIIGDPPRGPVGRVRDRVGERLARLERERTPSSRIALRSPVTGTVLERNVIEVAPIAFMRR